MLIMDIETAIDTERPNFVNFKMASMIRKGLKSEEAIAKAKTELLTSAKLPTNSMTGKVILSGFLSTKLRVGWEKLETKNDTLCTKMIGLDGKSEAEILFDTWAVIKSQIYSDGDGIVTYDGKRFDFPFLMQRSIINGVPNGTGMQFSAFTKRYSTLPHLDLHEQMNPNYGDHSPLTQWAYLIGATTELVSDANQIGKYLADKEYDKIIDHCEADVFMTYQLAQIVKGWVI